MIRAARSRRRRGNEGARNMVLHRPGSTVADLPIAAAIRRRSGPFVPRGVDRRRLRAGWPWADTHGHPDGRCTAPPSSSRRAPAGADVGLDLPGVDVLVPMAPLERASPEITAVGQILGRPYSGVVASTGIRHGLVDGGAEAGGDRSAHRGRRPADPPERWSGPTARVGRGLGPPWRSRDCARIARGAGAQVSRGGGGAPVHRHARFDVAVARADERTPFGRGGVVSTGPAETDGAPRTLTPVIAWILPAAVDRRPRAT